MTGGLNIYNIKSAQKGLNQDNISTQTGKTKRKTSYLNMLVISIPTKMTFTGSQTLINLHVSGSVVITPKTLNRDTITTETKFCTATTEQENS